MRIPKVCQYCGNGFTAMKMTTKYCSLQCAQKNYKKVKREDKITVAHNTYISVKQKKEDKLSDAPISKKPYLTVKDTCKLLNASDTTVRKAIREGRITTIRIGKKHIIRREDIERLFQKGF